MLSRPDAAASILCLAGDAGGAAALSPLLAALRADDQPLRLLAYGPALALWQSQGLQPEPAPSDPAAIDRACRAARLLLSATSCNELNLERRYWQAARAVACPTLAVLDYWSNYGQRFEIDKKPFWPERIAVMDELAASGMRAAGCPPERLCIVGHPGFDALSAEQLDVEQRTLLRQTLGIAPQRQLLVFVSQPLSELRTLLGQSLTLPDEQAILQQVIAALDAPGDAAPPTLLIRPHPREASDKYDRWCRPGTATAAAITVNHTLPSRQLVQAADLVLGIHSMLLLEACCLGCPVISLQPGQHPEPAAQYDPLPSNRCSASAAIYEMAKVIPGIRRYLQDATARQQLRAGARRACPPPGATAKLQALISAMMER